MAPPSSPQLSAFLVVSMLTCYLWFAGAVNEEGAALLQFKASIEGDPDGCMQNWNSSDGSPCSWNGVSCQDMRVVSISIPNRKLVGTLSPSLGSLSFLRHINLRNNQLRGSLPMELVKAQGLQSLVLYSNNFTGSLPSNIGSLGYLQILNLAQNFMNGPVPPSLLQLSRLRTVDLSFNKFSGRLPDGFGAHLKQLEKLDLSHNGFSGQVPSDLGNLTSIEGTLYLSHNNFSGRIPASLGDLPEKVYIDLSDNNLDGPIPQNGALVNRGPTAFLGNLLCGPPLKNPCQADNIPSPQPYFPGNGSYSPPESVEVGRSSKRKGLSSAAVIAIVTSDIVGICLIALAFLCCYWRLVTRRSKVDGEVYGKEAKEKRDCLCFRKDGSENLSDNVEQVDLVQLDSQVGFDLDELLKASAFVLGKSGIGIVYKVVLEDGLTLAVRRLGEGGLQRFKEFQTEVEAIGKVKHPNIVALRAYYWSVDEKLLIYDYIPNGNLNTALHGRSGTLTSSPISWLTRLSIMKGVAKGMAYLHEYSPKKYVHGDLTPSNILLGRIMEPYIADFGLGRLATIAGGSPMVQSDRVPGDSQQQSSEVSVSFPGSCYQAPEALKLLKPSQKWDIYSYGVILLEMISGRLPVILMGNSEISIVKWVEMKIEEHKPLSDVLDPTLAQEPDYEEDIVAVLRIALACVQTNPERRPSMRHISDVIDKLDSN